AETGDQRAALMAWESTWQGLSAPATAYLYTERYRWRRKSSNGPEIAADLVAAAQVADQDSSDPRLTGEVRRRIRRLVAGAFEARDSVFPAWVRLPIDDRTRDLMNTWVSTDSATSMREFLSAHWSELSNESCLFALDALSQLFPEYDKPRQLIFVIADGLEHGLQRTLDTLTAEGRALELVREWIATPTWTGSQRYLSDHSDLRSDPIVRRILAANDAPSARQHLAILSLTDHYPIPEVIDAVLDRTDAKDLAFRVIATGEPDLIRALWWASPHPSADPFTAPLLSAVLTALVTEAETIALDEQPDPLSDGDRRQSGDIPDAAESAATVAETDRFASNIREAAYAAAAAGTDRDRHRALAALESINTQFESLTIVIDALREPRPRAI
ncbi:hypothetical protein, partial [Nocardia sp. CC213A]